MISNEKHDALYNDIRELVARLGIQNNNDSDQLLAQFLNSLHEEDQ